MPFPEDQKENVLRPASVSHATIWDMADQKASQSAPVAQKSKNVLPTTPLIDCRSAKGTPYKCAPPYTLVVPIPPTTALNMRTPEYSWAHGLFLALHAMKLAFENMTGGETQSLLEAAEQLDTYRRIYRVSSTPPARHYLAKCRALRRFEAYGPTIGRLEEVCRRRAARKGQEHVDTWRFLCPHLLALWQKAPRICERPPFTRRPPPYTRLDRNWGEPREVATDAHPMGNMDIFNLRCRSRVRPAADHVSGATLL